MCITSLSTLLQGIVAVPSVFDVTIHGLKTDSREVASGDAFIALSGAKTPADFYVDKAITAGATVILLETEQAGECAEHHGALIVPVAGLRGLVGRIADRFFEHPSQRLRLIGVTGTNGKTSVCQYVAQLLRETGTPCGILGTLGYGMPGSLQPATHTTPDAVQVNRVLSRIVKQEGRAAVMEVSSHALDQGRVDNISMTGAVFTNLTRDHLDYHGSMEAYGAAKARLFEREELHFSVINFDDPFGRQLFEQLEGKCDRVRYSLHEAQTELWLREFRPTDDGFEAEVDGEWGRFVIAVPLMGSFNASNVLAAMATVLTLGVPVDRVQQAVGRLAPPPGRLERFDGANGVRVVVDYAHTADALANALAALRPHVDGELICVFGCGGDRDTGKRPDMAREAEKLADRVVVTDDNPRSEHPEAIARDILAGFSDSAKVTVIHDRAEAIQSAIRSATPNDLVLIAGKGHEAYQEIAGQKYPFSDAEQVRHNLKLNGGVA
ncbi:MULTISPECIES: UDP-N-acetylmuramoyl-L-alanyl-D-glutamate--2,6-diaminopimelate ligase [Marinobacter]|jgi:UDP-N-acetylmuramoyl-L-alanyl-D-glutamate--2,6-diaminopimelate ligase|uniref:UDP-N-acetylmuramoyl-L-alanyl-D-glutamate--2,6-diaminopimelate ligase n=1 Tax=Marinobacter salsuginis TaxID=418719 RepID=A0A5M3Q6D7_9GAMM|nr:UDP-N-acetylmuramoyl-L-alanyl-D-glutamate--2,6-diaminopimelate ligase [Marinobacter salsuginis]MBY6072617.1 UDP-N-acetylmuramoyl-L-alanyl-D-glutamate--2,6-diaminopimelate ligase [Marinobacter salsuginis]GBO90280.1 UDP-N-acetylmuramoyl-L-alanyl-D-glutamate--2,6-diaminopimelate ligase [Marinobacter salsuginis]|tara:strand:- start:2985 stop:4469 length:1485 start_codon:yes stop_codon:yes gene_type:complete